MSTIQGRFLWYDNMTADVRKALAFYTEVFGWQSRPYDNNPSYTLLHQGSQPFAGIMTLSEEANAQGAPNHWLAYVGCDDVDATVDNAKTLGASVYQPATDIEEGRFAVLADPQGVVFALFKPSGEPPERRDDEGMAWHELMTPDLETGFDFYSAVLGWKKTVAMDMGEQGTYQLFAPADMDEGSVGGMMALPAAGIPPHWLCYGQVDDVDRAIARIKAQGGQITHGPVDVPGGNRIATFLDNQGAAFAIHGR